MDGVGQLCNLTVLNLSNNNISSVKRWCLNLVVVVCQLQPFHIGLNVQCYVKFTCLLARDHASL